MVSRFVSLVVLASLLSVGSAAAQSVRLLGDFRDWSSYTATDGAGPVCFAMTKPTTVTPTPDGYTQAYLYLTSRPSENVSSEFNLVAGFTFQPDSAATVTVNGQTFNLFTQNDAAWLDDAGQSDALASAIRAGSSLVVEGTTSAGIKVAQTFSLAGSTAASQAVAAEC
jgi:hypothetical protein